VDFRCTYHGGEWIDLIQNLHNPSSISHHLLTNHCTQSKIVIFTLSHRPSRTHSTSLHPHYFPFYGIDLDRCPWSGTGEDVDEDSDALPPASTTIPLLPGPAAPDPPNAPGAPISPREAVFRDLTLTFIRGLFKFDPWWWGWG